MQWRQRVGPRGGWLWAAVVLVGAAAGSASGQDQLGTSADEDAFNAVKFEFNKLVDGSKPYNAKEHGSIVEKAAKYYIYPLSWVSVRNNKNQKDFGLPAVQERFRQVMEAEGTKSGKNREFMKAFTSQLGPRFREFFKSYKLGGETSQPAIHGALMLALFGKSRTDEASEFLASVAKDAKEYHPFIRMCAVKGLGEIPPYGSKKLEDLAAVESPQVVKEKRDRDRDRLEAIKEFIYNPMQLPPGATPEQVDAFYYLRREGVKALAQFQLPALSLDPKSGKVVGPAAHYLTLMFTRDNEGKYNLNFGERLEAALGLCQLLPAELPQYRPEVGLYLVATTLVDMMNEYRTDHTYFSVKVKEKDAPPRQPKLPWKATMERIDQGLKAMASNLEKDSPVRKNIEELNKQLDATLKAIRGLQPILTDAGQIQGWVNEHLTPESAEVYQGTQYLAPVPVKGKKGP
jgi:hypothetical protein